VCASCREELDPEGAALRKEVARLAGDLREVNLDISRTERGWRAYCPTGLSQLRRDQAWMTELFEDALERLRASEVV